MVEAVASQGDEMLVPAWLQKRCSEARDLLFVVSFFVTEELTGEQKNPTKEGRWGVENGEGGEGMECVGKQVAGAQAYRQTNTTKSTDKPQTQTKHKTQTRQVKQ